MIARGSDPIGEGLDIAVLREQDIDRLRLGWWSNHEHSQVERVVQQSPGLSVWMPSTSEYLLAGPWRHREEIVHIRELVAIRYPVELTRASIDRAKVDGRDLFLAVELTERRQPRFYDQAGMEMLEDVISYELTPVRQSDYTRMGGEFVRADVNNVSMLSELVEIDWSAFPWLWRNSPAEFRDYARQTGVELYLLRIDNQNVGYIGLTCYPGWGHIDRVAVLPDVQNRGIGQTLVGFAVERLRVGGANRIGLSTQFRNQRSQRLYTRLGFRRQQAGDYRIYGRALKPEIDLFHLVTGGVS